MAAHRYPQPFSTLVPSSQEGGNLIQADLAEKTMTAPGTWPVSPLPTGLDGSHPEPEPLQHDRTTIVGDGGAKTETPAQDMHAYRLAGGYDHDSAPWRET